MYWFTKYVFGTRVLYDLTASESTHNIKNLSSALSAPRMRSYADLMVKEASDFFGAWGEQGTRDLKEDMAKLIINTASRCLLGKEIRELLHERVAELYHDLDAGLTPLSFFWPTAPTRAHSRRDAARDEMQDLFRPFIKDRREGKTVGEDFLQTLIDSRDKHGQPYDDSQITGMLLLSIFAGQHTSSVTATWTGALMFLADKDLLLELLHEQQEVFGRHNGVFNWDSIGELKLLGQCIKEALRMYPPLLAIMRKVRKELKVGDDIVVPVGDIVVVSPPVCNWSEDVYTDPSVFDPHRFDADLEAQYPPFSHVAFGGGRHGCMGENFAYLQVKAIWSTMLQNFEMELVNKTARPELDYEALVVGPKGKVEVKFKRRPVHLLKMTLPPLPRARAQQRRPPAPGIARAAVTAQQNQVALGKDGKPLKRYTPEEVAKHNKEDDCWLIIKGKVYDVTDYVPQHKGGAVIWKKAGQDNTEGFFGDQHPSAAQQILEEYLIGTL